MKRLSNWLYKFSTGWIALVGLIVFLLFTALVLPNQAANAEVSNGEVGSPDLSFYYSSQKLYEMAEAYGEDGREAYIRVRFTFDLIWPLVYALFLSTAISWTFASIFPIDSRWRWFNIIPILGMIFDYLENITTSLVMYRYPATSDFIATIAPFFTAIKWIFVGGSFILLLIGIAGVILQTVRNRFGNSS